MNAVSFTTANYVARETGWAMRGWGYGDRVTNERFARPETYAERLGEVLAGVRALGFAAVDLWGAHLNPAWATDEHVAVARDLLARHDLQVTSLAAWVGPGTVERACEIALALGTDLIGAGTSGEVTALVPVLRRRGVRLAYENHPERTPGELLERIAAGGGLVGATVDTGWWATQGYDPVAAIQELGERVWHVHLKDVRARGEPHETCMWGDGIVDVEGCVRAPRRGGYAGALVVEHEPEDHDPSGGCRLMRERLEARLR